MHALAAALDVDAVSFSSATGITSIIAGAAAASALVTETAIGVVIMVPIAVVAVTVVVVVLVARPPSAASVAHGVVFTRLIGRGIASHLVRVRVRVVVVAVIVVVVVR